MAPQSDRLALVSALLSTRWTRIGNKDRRSRAQAANESFFETVSIAYPYLKGRASLLFEAGQLEVVGRDRPLYDLRTVPLCGFKEKGGPLGFIEGLGQLDVADVPSGIRTVDGPYWAMRTDIAIVLGAALIGAVILFIFRYDVTNNPGGTYRLDRWTGAVERCMFWGGIDDKKITCQ
jgi:hypothetical protein